jgi:hypothetical protein
MSITLFDTELDFGRLLAAHERGAVTGLEGHERNMMVLREQISGNKQTHTPHPVRISYDVSNV